MTDVAPFALRVTTPERSWIHRLSKGETIVGRAMPADVKIPDIYIARRHFTLYWDERLACHMLSVCGINGVTVNGTLLRAGTEPRQLSAGDELRIGGVSIRYEGVSETPDIAR